MQRFYTVAERRHRRFLAVSAANMQLFFGYFFHLAIFHPKSFLSIATLYLNNSFGRYKCNTHLFSSITVINEFEYSETKDTLRLYLYADSLNETSFLS